MTKMSAKRHLKELQWRFMLVALFFIVGATLAYTYQDVIMPLLLQPLNGEKLVYLTPGGGFSFVFLVSVYAGFALAFPVLLQQLYAFLRPALPKGAQRKSSILIISSLALLVAGITFGYIVAVPSALTFLYGFADQYVESSLTAESYLNFVVAYTIGIGIVFQIPLLLLLLHTIKPMSPGGLMKSEKWVVLLAFIIAAIITPTPDPVNQAIIAGPVIIVYQLGVIAVLMAIGKAKRVAKKAERFAAKEAAAPTALSTLQKLAAPQRALAAEAIATARRVEALKSITVEEAVPALELEYEEEPLTESLATIQDTTKETPRTDIPLQEAIAAEVHADSIRPVAKQPKAIDGFVRRPVAQTQIHQRTARPVAPPRPIQQARPATRSFQVDGIIAPPRPA